LEEEEVALPEKVGSLNNIGLTSEDAIFQARIKKKASKGCISKLIDFTLLTVKIILKSPVTIPYKILTMLLLIPKKIFAFLKFLIPLLLWHGPYEIVNYVSWECCGHPLKKLDKNEFLLSRYV